MTMRRIARLVLRDPRCPGPFLGGVFWTDRDTLLDAGPIQITRDEREGFGSRPCSPSSR